jgi:CheY-like chemotaxis protein
MTRERAGAAEAMIQLDAGGAPQLTPVRILVVEDEPFIRHAIAEELRELGACVAEAASANEAWDFLAAGGVVDLVFTDHQMPGSMTGAQLAARVRALHPAVQIIVTSGNFNAREWAGPVLGKPYPPSETAARLVEMAVEARKNGMG